MKSLYNNSMFNRYRIMRNNTFSSYTAVGFLSLLLSLSFFSMNFSFSQSAIATIDVDTSGDGRTAASDGEESIATDGDSLCSITDDIAGGKFSSLFEGIVNCDNSQSPNQFLVEYSYTKNPVKIGEKTYLTITVKDKDTGNPISNAFVTLAIEPPSLSYGVNTISTALAAATTSMQEVEKANQAMHTDNNGRAAFTVQVGPKSDVGIYDTELEVKKDIYPTSFEQMNFQVISQSENVNTMLRRNNEDATGGTGGSNLGLGGTGGAGAPSNPACPAGCAGDGGAGGAGGSAAGDGGDGGDAVANGGNAIGGDGGAAFGGDGGDGGDAVGGNGGTAIGGDGGDGGDAVGVAQDNAICDGIAIGGAGGYGGDATKGIQGTDGEDGSDEMVIC